MLKKIMKLKLQEKPFGYKNTQTDLTAFQDFIKSHYILRIHH